MSGIQIVFVVIAALGLAAALGTILAKNLVHAGLYLVAFFFTTACQFVLLEAEFLAALQVLVYIGAVAILLMFGIMLTRNVQGGDSASAGSAWQLPGLMAGLGMFLMLAYGIAYETGLGGPSWAETDERPSITPVGNRPAPLRTEAVNNMAKVVGDELMTRYVIGFEVAGLLLTAALVGAIALAHREEEDPATPRAGRRTGQRPADPGPGNGPAASRPLESSTTTPASVAAP